MKYYAHTHKKVMKEFSIKMYHTDCTRQKYKVKITAQFWKDIYSCLILVKKHKHLAVMHLYVAIHTLPACQYCIQSDLQFLNLKIFNFSQQKFLNVLYRNVSMLHHLFMYREYMSTLVQESSTFG